MEYSQLDIDFLSYLEHIAKVAIGKAEIELEKAKECKDLLELPQRKENWTAMENADEEIEEHMERAMSHLKEVVMLTRGLEVFKDGLVYEEMKNSKFIKSKDVKVE